MNTREQYFLNRHLEMVAEIRKEVEKHYEIMNKPIERIELKEIAQNDETIDF